MDHQLHGKLRSWARWRHPRLTRMWRYCRYWHRRRRRLDFCDGTTTLVKYQDTRKRPHIKVIGDQSPSKGDWLYWALRLGREPTKPQRVIVLLRKQHGKCQHCRLRFRAEDVMEVHHIDHDPKNNVLDNLALLHAHCHDEVHR